MIGQSAIAFTTLAFTSLLAIVNPLSAVPLYVTATADQTDRQRAATLRLAVATGVIALVISGLAGTFILRFFGITTYAFRIAGGLIFLSIGTDMLNARRTGSKITASEEQEAEQKQDVGIIPLGIPTLAGPGSITTVITLTAQSGDSKWELAGLYGAIVAVMLVSWGLLAVAPFIVKRVGRTGMNVMTRLMGLLVMVVGVQFIIEGVRTVAVDILNHS
ncbi:MAG: MarC family protein [Gemmatimonadaceae bacterium]